MKKRTKKKSKTQTSLTRAFNLFVIQFSEILEDPLAFEHADEETIKIAKEHPDWSHFKVMKLAGTRTLLWKKRRDESVEYIARLRKSRGLDKPKKKRSKITDLEWLGKHLESLTIHKGNNNFILHYSVTVKRKYIDIGKYSEDPKGLIDLQRIEGKTIKDVVKRARKKPRKIKK